jgi:hypothetical protein
MEQLLDCRKGCLDRDFRRQRRVGINSDEGKRERFYVLKSVESSQDDAYCRTTSRHPALQVPASILSPIAD